MSFTGNTPIVDGIQLADANPTKADTVNYTVTFNQSVTGVDIADFTLKSTAVTGANIAAVTGSGASYNVSVNTGKESGTLGLNLVDNDSINNSVLVPLGDIGQGNGNFTGLTYTIDKTPPAVSFAPVAPDPRNTSVTTIPITFSEPVTGFNTADLSLTRNGVAVPLTGATLNSTNNTNWTLDNLTGLTDADGNYQLSLTAAGSGIVDRAGNALNTNASNIWSADFTAPTAASSFSNINAAGGNTYNFTVTYTDNTALNVSTLDSKDILVAGPDGKTQQATLVNFTPLGNGTPRSATYSFVPPGGTWDTADNGIYTVQLQPQQVSDTVGNFDVAGNLGTFTVNIAPAAPAPAVTAAPAPAAPAPAITAAPAPVVTVPVFTAPVVTAPVVTAAPAPAAPAPAITAAPAPAAPAPAITAAPAPVVTAPVFTAPVVTAPVVTAAPAPVVTAAPAPVVTAPVFTAAPTPPTLIVTAATPIVTPIATAAPTPPTPIVTAATPIVTPIAKAAPTPPTPIVTATPTPQPIVTPTPAPTPIDTMTPALTSIGTLIDRLTSIAKTAPTATTATATPMRTLIAMTTRTPVFTAPPTSARTVSDCPPASMPIRRSTSTPMPVNRDREYDPLTCPQNNQVNYRSNTPAQIAKPIALSAPNCPSVAGDRDNDDFLIGSPKNTNDGNQKSDRVSTIGFSLLGEFCASGTPQRSTLNNVQSFGLTTQLQFSHTTLVNTASQCQIRLI